MNQPSISETSQTNWERVAAMQDKDIDLSEIPEVTKEQMDRAVLRVGGSPATRGMQRVTMVLNAFVVEFFQAQAGERDYQALMNEALVEYMRRHIGSSFDDVLAEEGILEACEEQAIKKLLAEQIERAMRDQGVTRTAVASRIQMSQAALDRLLDPHNSSVTLHTLQKAAQAVGKRLRLELTDAAE